MASKTSPYSFNYSVKYQVGGYTNRSAPVKPKVLSIASIPDDFTVTMDYVDHRGIMFRKTGNFEMPAYNEIEREDIVLGGADAGVPDFSKPALAFVRICDADANAIGLKLAQQLIDENHIPTLNSPDKILATKRDVFYQCFSGLDGVVIPKTVRIAPRYCKDVRTFLEKGEIRLPCIFRPAGGHNSRGVQLIEKLDDTRELECFAFDGRDYYVSELIDCRDGDGLYRKFRAVWIDGRLYPRHFFVSDKWCVDGKSKFTEEKYLSEEKYFMENFQSYMGACGMSRLERFCASVGLDYFGLDLNLRPDGTLVVFEANACMAAFRRTGRDYLDPHVEIIRVALKDMMLRFYKKIESPN